MYMQLDQKLAEKLKLALVALPPTHLKKHWGRGDENGTLLRECQLSTPQGQRRN